MGKEKYNKEELIRLLIHEGKSYKEVAAMRGDGSTGEAIRKAANRYGIKVSDRKKLRKCEYCGKEHDGSFGSGRFCCSDCAKKLKDFTKHVGQSYGEIFVMKALENLNINYISQYKIKGEDLGISDIRNYILVDYYVEYNGLKYFIEVNGQQHYIDKPYFYATTSEFKERLKRDKSISDYSISNNIIYIEIPYTKLQNYDKVFNIIKRIFINHEDVNTVIGKLPEIKYRKEDQDG